MLQLSIATSSGNLSVQRSFLDTIPLAIISDTVCKLSVLHKEAKKQAQFGIILRVNRKNIKALAACNEHVDIDGIMIQFV